MEVIFPCSNSNFQFPSLDIWVNSSHHILYQISDESFNYIYNMTQYCRRCSSPCPEGFLRGPALTAEAQEVSFSIKKSFGSRKGWKIMPDDGQQNIDSSALQNVVSLIKDMELKVG